MRWTDHLKLIFFSIMIVIHSTDMISSPHPLFRYSVIILSLLNIGFVLTDNFDLEPNYTSNIIKRHVGSQVMIERNDNKMFFSLYEDPETEIVHTKPSEKGDDDQKLYGKDTLFGRQEIGERIDQDEISEEFSKKLVAEEI
jgi:hypothetical protein